MDLGVTKEILARVSAAPRFLLLLDFDGTLAPIVPHPDQARFAAPAKEALERLSAMDNVRAGIISARALRDVSTRVGLPQLIYAGNHGMEIEGPGLRLTASPPPLAPILAEIMPYVAATKGAWIEDKGLSATIHMRAAPAEARIDLIQEVRRVVEASPAHRWRNAVEAIEVVPKGEWNKGTAALWIRREIGWEGALAMYAGDDTSDEDAFLSLADGITVRVGPGATKARYRASSPNGLWKLLGSLADALGGKINQKESSHSR